jgi:ABC-type molybdate transport system substrate-binding protein
VPDVDTVSSATGASYSLTPVKVTVATLMMSKKQEEAEAFVRFLLSDEAAEIVREFGFKTPKEVRKQFYNNGLRIP